MCVRWGGNWCSLRQEIAFGFFVVNVVAMLLAAKFSRDGEREADHYGKVCMFRAGYDLKSAVAVQELLLKESGSHNDLLTELLSDHLCFRGACCAGKGLCVTSSDRRDGVGNATQTIGTLSLRSYTCWNNQYQLNIVFVRMAHYLQSGRACILALARKHPDSRHICADDPVGDGS